MTNSLCIYLAALLRSWILLFAESLLHSVRFIIPSVLCTPATFWAKCVFTDLAYITRVTVNRFVDAAISNAAECLSVWRLCIRIENTHKHNAIMDVKKIVAKTKTNEIQVRDCWWLLIIANITFSDICWISHLVIFVECIIGNNILY